VLGWLVDHHGPRWPWVVMTLFMPAVALLYPLGGFMPLFVGCTFVTGMLTTSWAVTAPAMLELSPDGDKSAYIALTNLAALAPATVGPFIMAGLIEGSGYRAAFLATAVAGVLAFFVALTLRGRTTGRSHKIEQDEVTHRCGEEETVKAVQ
jgi:MFS family permease